MSDMAAMMVDMTETVTVREVNQHTSDIVNRVRAGEELIVTLHGQPTMRLLPYQPMTTYERLVAEGRIIPPAVSGPMVIHPLPSKGIDIDAILEAERADTDWQ